MRTSIAMVFTGSGISSTRQFPGVGYRMPGISGVCLGGTVGKDHVIMEII